MGGRLLSREPSPSKWIETQGKALRPIKFEPGDMGRCGPPRKFPPAPTVALRAPRGHEGHLFKFLFPASAAACTLESSSNIRAKQHAAGNVAAVGCRDFTSHELRGEHEVSFLCATGFPQQGTQKGSGSVSSCSMRITFAGLTMYSRSSLRAETLRFSTAS